MNFLRKTFFATMAVAAVGFTAGCQRNEPYARKQADAIDHRADKVEQRGKDEANRTKDAMENKADAMHDRADLIRDGITYKVVKVDRAAQTVVLTRFDKDANKLDDKMMQSGRELTLTYGDLEKFDMAHHKAGAEIADKLHDGDKVTVFMDATNHPTKIDY